MKIVVGHHDTEEGRAAMKRAVALAREQDAELQLVSLVALPSNSDDARKYDEARSSQQELLEAVAAEYRESGVACKAHVPNGVKRPADALVSVAKIEDADLIVIGMRRRSRVGKLVLGSTAQEVLLDSHCDVLSVKATPQEA